MGFGAGEVCGVGWQLAGSVRPGILVVLGFFFFFFALVAVGLSVGDRALLVTFALQAAFGEGEDFEAFARDGLSAGGAGAVDAGVESREGFFDFVELGGLDGEEAGGEFVFETVGGAVGDVGRIALVGGELVAAGADDVVDGRAPLKQGRANAVEEFLVERRDGRSRGGLGGGSGPRRRGRRDSGL